MDVAWEQYAKQHMQIYAPLSKQTILEIQIKDAQMRLSNETPNSRVKKGEAIHGDLYQREVRASPY
jgi:hypothetical protein